MKPTRIFSITLLAMLSGGCHQKTDTKDNGDPKVEDQTLVFPANSPQLSSLEVTQATPPISLAAHFPGRVVWNDNLTARVYTPFAGRVTKILADVRSEVSSNTPLALIESPDFGQAQAESRRAETDLSLAERNLARMRDLYEHGAAPQKDVLVAEADEARARAERQRTSARARLYGGADEGVDQLFRLASPVSGVVVERSMYPGQEVRPDTMLANSDKLAAPLFIITEPTKVWVLVDVAEQDLACFRPGMSAVVRSRAYPDDTFLANVELVSDQIETATRMVPVRLAVENRARLLKAEMLVSVELAPELSTGLEVPTKAVVLKGEHHFVFREDGDGRFVRQRVSVGSEQNGKIIVRDGLKAGERVVSSGSLLLEQILASE